MITGSRAGASNWLNRLISRAMARNLTAFVVPGLEVARAHGLDLSAADIQLAATPRHANVLLVVGQLPPKLNSPATVVYAQMPRPRAILALGTEDISPLPSATATGALSQEGLVAAAAKLREVLASDAWSEQVEDFVSDAVGTRTEYTCPMHPEVVRDEPGQCPKCSMDLVPRELQGSASNEQEDNSNVDEMQEGRYTCPMHPEIRQDAPGQCPKCGMDLQAQDEGDGEGSSEGGMQSMGHGEGEMGDMDMGFMSMVEMTKDLPRSPDGLPMEWVEVPYGPLFPGLPGGLNLEFTLDGNSVASTTVQPGSASRGLVHEWHGLAIDFPHKLGKLDLITPFAYRLLAIRALESVAAIQPDRETVHARIYYLERERVLSHLNWLAQLGFLLGCRWLQNQASRLHIDIYRGESGRVRDSVEKLTYQVEQMPVLHSRLDGIGKLTPVSSLLARTGPVARANGEAVDARANEVAYRELGFSPVVLQGDDALARLRVRLGEIGQSLELLSQLPVSDAAVVSMPERVTESGSATVETPRGGASLEVYIEDGDVTYVSLSTPSEINVRLIPPVTGQLEVADALVAVSSLDISPWEIDR